MGGPSNTDGLSLTIVEITSLNDALSYAKRKYSPAQFSWGLSFSPSSIVTLLGLNK